MIFEAIKQSMAWMERGLQISLKRHALLAAGAFCHAMNYG